MNENLIRIIVEILLIIVILIGLLWKRVENKKPDNPGRLNLEMIPGHSEECERRGTEITKITEAIKRIDENMANIWRYIKKNGKPN